MHSGSKSETSNSRRWKLKSIYRKLISFMKKNLLFIILVLLWGCSTFHYVPNDIIGTYTQVRYDSLKYVELFINKTSFTLANESND